MFTSRAEFRLHLRIDNADRRLTPQARRLGLIDDETWATFERKQQRMQRLQRLLETEKLSAGRLAEAVPDLPFSAVAGQSWAQLLRRPEVTLERILPAIEDRLRGDETLAPMLTGAPDQLAAIRRNELRAVETEIKFSGYLDQQRRAIQKLKDAETVRIPDWLNYTVISGLSREMQEKLSRVRPATIGQASRIPGVTPAALGLVHVSIRIQSSQRAEQASQRGEQSASREEQPTQSAGQSTAAS